MSSSQQQVICRVSAWLEGKPVWLATILQTWGSSPRPRGAMLACTLEGELVGSISGGCIEEDFLEQLCNGRLKARHDEHGKPFTIRYGATAEEQQRLKLPCGGQLLVLLEYLDADAANRAVFAQLAAALAASRKVSRIVELGSGAVHASSGEARTAVVIDEQRMTHYLSPMYRLLLLGAGDVARHVAQLALALEYEVCLCDPRPRYLDNWHVAGVEMTSRLPDDVVRERFANAFSGIIALAHDPRVDDMALMEALRTEAFYVGAMGSERTSVARRKRLPELGLTAGQIARLHAPIGLPISSRTPAEIAVSIMAQVTAVRHEMRVSR